MRFWIPLAIWAVLVCPTVRAQNTTPTDSSFHPPKSYQLALGASYTFGLQEAKVLDEVKAGTYDPASFNTGYVDDLATDLGRIDPGIETVNLGCPGQTSTGFFQSCRFHLIRGFDLHTNYPDPQLGYPDSQLGTAVVFLRAHPGQVSPITLDIGQNDLNMLNGDCKFKSHCALAGLPAVLDTFRANLAEILTQLRTAARDSEIVVLLQIDTDALEYPFTTDEYVALNQVIRDVANSTNARVADVYSAFNLAPQPQTLCTLTAVCDPPLFDSHPTDLGYEAMANVIWQASGYEKLGK
jgi:lysophospholipase L1-like esterase